MQTKSTGFIPCWFCGRQGVLGKFCDSCGAKIQNGRAWQKQERPQRIEAQVSAPVSQDAGRRCLCVHCGKFIFLAYAFRGVVEATCRRCRKVNVFSGSASDAEISAAVEGLWDRRQKQVVDTETHKREGRKVVKRHFIVQESLSDEELVALIEERWRVFGVRKARERAEVASGIRFQVLQRDCFRCRYCGISVDEGAILHVDHVVPVSRGGPTTLENLVTACMDCNLGKSNRLLHSLEEPATVST